MTEKSDAAETAAERKRGTGAAAGAVKAATAASGPDRSVRRGKVLYQVAPTRSATAFLKPFMLRKFKPHPISTYVSDPDSSPRRERKKRLADTDQHLAVYGRVGVGGKKSPKKQKKR